MTRATGERGALLGVVMVLLGVLFAASAFALWSLRGDTGAAGNDRLARQLFDCAELGLAWGKQYFSTTARSQWDNYLSTPVGAALPSPPFPAGPGPSAAVAGYPGGAPYTTTVTSMQTVNAAPINMTYTVGIFDEPENETPENYFHSSNNRIVVYSRCTDPVSKQYRAVQVLLDVPLPFDPCAYGGQAGGDCRNSGNMNR